MQREQTYLIQITEQQRALLESGLRHLVKNAQFANMATTEELRILLDMTKGLPASEAAQPGVLHGFAL